MRDGPLTDASTQRDRKRREKDILLQREEDFRAVMSLPAGRRFIWRLIDDTSGVFTSSFAGEAPLSMAFKEGSRAVGIALMKESQRVARGDYVLMLTEQVEERLADIPNPAPEQTRAQEDDD